VPLVERAGAELYWERHGAGPPLVLAAGLGGVGSYWAPNLPALTQHFTVLTFDQRGTGASSKVRVQSVEEMAADIAAVMDAAEFDSAHFLGHSTGGAIGVALALERPERLRSLMVYASTTCGDPYRRKLLGLRRQIHEQLGAAAYGQYTSLLLYPPYWINANEERLAAAETQAAGQLGPPDVQASRLDAILSFDRRAELSKIRVPTMVLCADDDILTPRYFSEEYARLIPGARALYVPKGGHALSRTEPELFNQIALQFFTEMSAS
jgi:aminoacrylate hydrolase